MLTVEADVHQEETTRLPRNGNGENGTNTTKQTKRQKAPPKPKAPTKAQLQAQANQEMRDFMARQAVINEAIMNQLKDIKEQSDKLGLPASTRVGNTSNGGGQRCKFDKQNCKR